jgi:hypothetical protein
MVSKLSFSSGSLKLQTYFRLSKYQTLLDPITLRVLHGLYSHQNNLMKQVFLLAGFYK